MFVQHLNTLDEIVRKCLHHIHLKLNILQTISFNFSIHSNPGAGKCSISFWIRFVSNTNSFYQTILGSGTSRSNTGILIRVLPEGEKIFIRVIYSGKEVFTPITSVRDTLKKTWAHVVTTHDPSSELHAFSISLF